MFAHRPPPSGSTHETDERFARSLGWVGTGCQRAVPRGNVRVGMGTKAPATKIFFRDDDAGELTPELRRVVELLLEERVPCNYVAVPAYVTPESAAWLREKKAANPGLVNLNQHGFVHEQVIRGRHRYSEFGGGKSYAEQRAAIEEGKRILEKMFGDDLGTDVFTPPANRFDLNTLRVMRDLGFTIHSGLVKAKPHRRAVYRVGWALETSHLFGTPISYHERVIPEVGIFDLSTAIDVDEEPNLLGTDVKLKSADDLLAELDQARGVLGVVGVMIHHQRYKSQSKVDALRTFIHGIKARGMTFDTIEGHARALGWTKEKSAA